MNYPDPEHIPSAERQRRLYVQAVEEIKSLRQQVKNENIVAKDNRAELLETRKEVKTVRAKNKSFRLQLTKKELATKNAANASKFAAIGAVLTEILYQTFDVVGYIGGSQWVEWWQTEQVYGVMVVVMTSIVGFMARAAHE
jgi:hypothetical protein|tara:strand:+ start:1334 stop:1756 length:423 start_codon:yes stop_codon:yes gene_type:complete